MLRFMGSQRVGHDWATELNPLQSLMLVSISGAFILTVRVTKGSVCPCSEGGMGTQRDG